MKESEVTDNRYSALEDERIIEFVRDNECIYNVRHYQYRDRHLKNQLWEELAEEINKDAVSVKKRWRSMRDYFVRSQEHTPGDYRSEREERMAFLLETTIFRRKDRQEIQYHLVEEKFTALEDERIIDFVRYNECLYNIRHPQYRDKNLRDDLWKQLTEELNMNDILLVKRRWASMRDYFLRNREKTTGPYQTERDKQMMFLLDTAIINPKSSLPTEAVKIPKTTSRPKQKKQTSEKSMPDQSMYSESTTTDQLMNIELAIDDETMHSEPTTAHGTMHSEPTTADQSMHTKPSTAEQFMQFVMNRPRPPSVKLVVKDHMRVFCDSVYSTMCTLPAHEVARVKLEISNLMGMAELENAKKSLKTTKIK